MVSRIDRVKLELVKADPIFIRFTRRFVILRKNLKLSAEIRQNMRLSILFSLNYFIFVIFIK